MKWVKVIMKWMIYIAVIAAMALPLMACGNKGKLKSPSQIEEERAKKERKAVEKAKKEAKKEVGQQ